jgi:hypothetical protein
VKAVFKFSSVRRLGYCDLIILNSGKISSQRKVDPKKAVKRRNMDRTEAPNKF